MNESTTPPTHSEAVVTPSECPNLDHLGKYSKWDQAVAGYIVGRLMLAGVLSCSRPEDEELISEAMVATAKALRVIPQSLKDDEWPLNL